MICNKHLVRKSSADAAVHCGSGFNTIYIHTDVIQ
ncbi:hypothetical protein W822_14145 [Advenella kashmirensis W13003]|uniref:Uncharacterized protein n=1 Tax=Advenella kashmirensis W13003 TaxID=1424334 RepID=V8QSS2_9BURK|nr:hypothetical protein W822_14145 [Advenella kashmirensis W13003]